MNNIAIIGSGSLLSNKIEKLFHNNSEYKFVRFTSNSSNLNSELIDYNYNEYKSKYNNINYIIHLAGWANIYRSFDEHNHSFKRNVSTVNFSVELLKQNPNAKLIFISSSEVYGDCLDYATEDYNCNPSNIYGIHKYIAEKLIIHYSKLYGFAYCFLRCGGFFDKDIKKGIIYDLKNPIEHVLKLYVNLTDQHQA